MSFRIVIAPYRDPACGLDWPDQTPEVRRTVSALLAKSPIQPIEFQLHETDHGIGADWATLTIEVLVLGASLFFGIPAAHGRIRDALGEWRRIKQSVDKLIAYVRGTHAVLSFSIEVAFYHGLAELSKTTDVDDLELLTAAEYVGKANNLEPSFERALLLYYLFAFKRDYETLYLLVISSQLKLVGMHELPLDPRYRAS